jgi:phosphoglycolate phosphatase
MRALLWDIDGTLTRGSGSTHGKEQSTGGRALTLALHARPAALEELRRMRLDGRTDRSIMRELVAAELGRLLEPWPEGAPQPLITRSEEEARRLAGASAEERRAAVRDDEIERLIAAYLDQLGQLCEPGRYLPLPGIAELIPLLDRTAPVDHPLRERGAHERVLLGLCTGNVAEGARIKLTSAGLWGHFPFGGFGSDHESRPRLVEVAWQRARALGATEAVVIDDAALGVKAARDAGLPSIGVATGRTSERELLEAGATLAVRDFSDVERSLALLLGPLG